MNIKLMNDLSLTSVQMGQTTICLAAPVDVGATK